MSKPLDGTFYQLLPPEVLKRINKEGVRCINISGPRGLADTPVVVIFITFQKGETINLNFNLAPIHPSSKEDKTCTAA